MPLSNRNKWVAKINKILLYNWKLDLHGAVELDAVVRCVIIIIKDVSRYGNGWHECHWLEWLKVTVSVSGTRSYLLPLSELGTSLMKSCWCPPRSGTASNLVDYWQQLFSIKRSIFRTSPDETLMLHMCDATLQVSKMSCYY